MFASAAGSECDTSETSKPAISRYIIKGGEVYDKNTNLSWLRCSQGQRWDEDSGCEGVAKIFMFGDENKDSTHKWRLPTLDELQTIVAERCKNPAVNEEIFPNTVAGWYWTNTPTGAARRMLVNFSNGDITYGNPPAAVRLVRTGQ
jgi:hypothetical protein